MSLVRAMDSGSTSNAVDQQSHDVSRPSTARHPTLPEDIRLAYANSAAATARRHVRSGSIATEMGCPRRVRFSTHNGRGTDIAGWSQSCHERTNSNLTAAEANARGRNASFPWLRPVLADRCRSPQNYLPTMRVQLRGCSSAQRFRAHSRRYGSCGYRHALQVPARDAPSFACSSF